MTALQAFALGLAVGMVLGPTLLIVWCALALASAADDRMDRDGLAQGPER